MFRGIQRSAADSGDYALSNIAGVASTMMGLSDQIHQRGRQEEQDEHRREAHEFEQERRERAREAWDIEDKTNEVMSHLVSGMFPGAAQKENGGWQLTPESQQHGPVVGNESQRPALGSQPGERPQGKPGKQGEQQYEGIGMPSPPPDPESFLKEAKFPDRVEHMKAVTQDYLSGEEFAALDPQVQTQVLRQLPAIQSDIMRHSTEFLQYQAIRSADYYKRASTAIGRASLALRAGNTEAAVKHALEAYEYIPDGKVAWVDRESGQIYLVDGFSEKMEDTGMNINDPEGMEAGLHRLQQYTRNPENFASDMFKESELRNQFNVEQMQGHEKLHGPDGDEIYRFMMMDEDMRRQEILTRDAPTFAAQPLTEEELGAIDFRQYQTAKQITEEQKAVKAMWDAQKAELDLYSKMSQVDRDANNPPVELTTAQRHGISKDLDGTTSFAKGVDRARDYNLQGVGPNIMVFREGTGPVGRKGKEGTVQGWFLTKLPKCPKTDRQYTQRDVLDAYHAANRDTDAQVSVWDVLAGMGVEMTGIPGELGGPPQEQVEGGGLASKALETLFNPVGAGMKVGEKVGGGIRKNMEDPDKAAERGAKVQKAIDGRVNRPRETWLERKWDNR